MKTTAKPIHLWAPIQRCDDEQRIVEAYAFVNEVVPGEGGLCLSREAMEAATADYMKWANIREMHQAIAAGVALDVTWDNFGAFMRFKVVDDAAWKKVKEGVYKGLSVGVKALLMQGKKVLQCEWYETSLCDRPKDQDALILSYRSTGPAPDAEYEVEVLPDTVGPDTVQPDENLEGVTRMEGEDKDKQDATGTETPALETETEAQRMDGEAETVTVEVTVSENEIIVTPLPTFNTYLQSAKDGQEIAKLENGLMDGYYVLLNVLDEIYFSNADNKADLVKASIQQFVDYLNSVVSDSERCANGQSIKDAIARMVQVDVVPVDIVPEVAVLTQRMQAAESSASETSVELTRVQGALETATADLATAEGEVQRLQGEVTKLKAQPSASPPVRYPHAAQREFLAGEQVKPSPTAVTLRSRLTELDTTLRTEQDAKVRQDGVQEMQRIKMALHSMGESLIG